MPISENGVSFFGSGGHSHNGVNSTIIDVGSYSLFDFSLGYTGSQSRINRQSVNQNAMEDWIVRVINSKVLQPSGLNLAPDTLNGKSIRANTITADQIAANTITANEISANTITANELSTNLVLVNNTIRSNIYTSGSTGWQIASNGKAEFSDITVRGNVYAISGEIAGWQIDGDSIINAAQDTAGYNQYIELNPIDGIETTRYTGSFWGSGFFSTVSINRPFVPGIDVTGDASGETLTTTIRSSGVTGKYIDASTRLHSDNQLSIGGYENESQSNVVGTATVYASSAGFVTITRPGNCLVLNETSTGNSSQQVAEFRRRGVQPGSAGIYVSNTAVAYSTTSDYRLKTNIAEIPESLDLLNKLNPVKFDWINSEEKGVYGFLAHELQEVVPYAVMGEKDAKDDEGNDKYQSVDLSFVVPVLTAALKEAVAKIEQLEARLQALEDV